MTISTLSSLFISHRSLAIEGAQVAVEAEASSSTPFVPIDEVQAFPKTHINLVEASCLQVNDPLFDFDGFQLQDPHRDEGFNSIQQESVVIQVDQPNVILQSFSLNQHIKANWEKFKKEYKINI